MKRTALLNGVCGLPLLVLGLTGLAVKPAAANDLTISTATSSAVSTATASGGTPGNITITSSGSVSGNISTTSGNITTATPAVTLNSNNFVSNAGTISNTYGTQAVGVNIVGNNTGSFTNSGTITIPAAGSPFSSVDQFGVLLNGNGSFTGNIVSTAGSSITVSGITPTAIGIQAPLVGNLTLGGTVKATGSGAIGVMVAAPITGAFSNSGIITTASETTSTSTLNVSPGSPVEIGSSITGGFLNSGTLSTVGTSAALLISPSAAGSVNNLTLGAVADTANPGFSVLNRGNITAVANQPGTNALGFQVGSPLGATSGLNANLTGGIYNSGLIAASATSANTNQTGAVAAASDANTLVIGFGANVGTLVNAAGGNITALTAGPLGGNATALTIQAGGNLSSLTNAGTISASATTTDPAIASLASHAIRDQSGTLTLIVNSGTISASATTLSNGGQSTVAVDLNPTTAAVTFSDSGTVMGDVIFGHSTANLLTIEGPHAFVDGRIQSTGSVDIAISAVGTGGMLETSSAATVGNLTVGNGGTLNLGVGQSTTVVSANGLANFNNGSHLELTPVALLPAGGNITLIHSNTASGIVFANMTSTLSSAAIPFLYTGNISESLDGKSLILSVQRKSAGALGLTGAATSVYEPAIAAALTDAQLGAAFSTLTSSSQVQAALDQMAPLANDAPKLMAETISDSNTDAVGDRQRLLAFNGTPDADSAFWGRGFYDFFDNSGASGFDGHATGGVVGADYSQPGKGHFGVALTLFDGTVTGSDPVVSRIESEWTEATFYMGFLFSNVFLNAQFNVGGAKLQGERDVTIASLERSTHTTGWTELMVSQNLTGGYVFNFGSFKVAPEISFDAMFLNDSKYQETGGTGLDLAVAAHSQNSVRGFVGVTAGGAYAVDDYRIVPQLLAGYSHEFLNGTPLIDAAFIAAPDSTFAVPGPQIDSSKLIAGGNVNFSLNKWSVGLSYNISDEAKSVTQSAAATLTARF